MRLHLRALLGYQRLKFKFDVEVHHRDLFQIINWIKRLKRDLDSKIYQLRLNLQDVVAVLYNNFASAESSNLLTAS